ncbi:MAG: FliH/SctL family protein [Defluviitaleaceae bacterium]|nr:FliH/SctL family protein [Defluviitaleaceae bacterium]
MSKIYKSSQITIDEDRIITIDVEQIVPEVLPEETEGTEEFFPTEFGDEDVQAQEEEEEISPDIIAAQIIEQAESEAAEITAKAQAEAEGILEKARLEAESLRESSGKEGYDKGYNEGLKDTEQMKQEAREIVESAHIERGETIKTAEPEIIELVSKLTKKLLLDEAEINPDVIAILVRSGLSQTTLSSDIKVRVSKYDYENLLDRKDQIISSFEGISNLDFSEDLALPAGGCVIETEFGQVDASMDKQCDELIKNLNYLFKNR